MSFFHQKDLKLENVEPGIDRRILSHSDNLMAVEVHFAAQAVGEPHSHAVHEQMTYVKSGSFEVQLGEEKRVLKAGDGFCARQGVLHGVVALEEDSVLLDLFNPPREDFL